MAQPKIETGIAKQFLEGGLKKRRGAKPEEAPAVTPVDPSKPTYPPSKDKVITDFNATLNRILRRDFDALIKPKGLTWEGLFADMPNAAFVVVEYFDDSARLQSMQLSFERGVNPQFVFFPESERRLKAMHAPVLMSAGQIVRAAIRAYEQKQS